MTKDDISKLPYRTMAYKRANMYHKDITILYVGSQLVLFIDNDDGLEATMELEQLVNYKKDKI